MTVLDPGGPAHALAPAPVAELLRLNGVAAAAAPGRATDLCRVRLLQLHGAQGRAADLGAALGLSDADTLALDQWWEEPGFDTQERAALALTEQFALSVADVTQQDVDRLLVHHDEHAVYAFVMALYVFDLTTRADLVLNDLLAPEED